MTLHTFRVQVGDQVFVDDGLEEVGAVREVARDHLLIYIENAGDFRVDGPSVRSAHDGKVVLDSKTLADPLLAAIADAHRGESE
jgi:ribosomal protein L24